MLTTELAVGARFAEAQQWSQEQRDLAGEAIFRFVFRSFYRLHLFNGDPHPGNYLFRPDGRVTFLDFGLVKRFTPSDIAHIQRLIETIVLDPDPVAFRRAMEDAGFLRTGAAGLRRCRHRVLRPLLQPHARARSHIRSPPEFASEVVRRFFDVKGPYGEVMAHANVPPAFAVVQRVNLGLFAVLAQLGAAADWRSIGEELWPWVDGPPAGALGATRGRVARSARESERLLVGELARHRREWREHPAPVPGPVGPDGPTGEVEVAPVAPTIERRLLVVVVDVGRDRC